MGQNETARGPVGPRVALTREWRNGRRAVFRWQCPYGRGGSNPPSRTHHEAPHHEVRGFVSLGPRHVARQFILLGAPRPRCAGAPDGGPDELPCDVPETRPVRG